MSEELETGTNENSNKMNSRKFIVWLLWSILSVALVVMGFIKNNDEILLKAMEYYFWMSGMYIGGNVLCKGITAYKTKDEATE